MYSKNLKASLIYKGLYVVMCAVALVLEFGLPKGHLYLYALNYYTVLSNLVCLAFFASALGPLIKALKSGRDLAWHPRTEGAVVFCIAITGIIYAGLLAPAAVAEGDFFSFRNMALHYVGPAMVVLDWLLFCPKGRLRPTDPLLWLFIPLSYLCYILLRSTVAGNIGPSASRFPYPFIDPAVQGGWGAMLRGVGLIALGMAALGYLVFLIDRWTARKKIG